MSDPQQTAEAARDEYVKAWQAWLKFDTAATLFAACAARTAWVRAESELATGSLDPARFRDPVVDHSGEPL